jgi:uncharacterized damage-inducible protein DinB
MTETHAPAAGEIADLKEHLNRYRGVTLQTLEWVPDEKLGWKPQEGLRSFAEHFIHIAQVESYHIRGLLAGDWNLERYFTRPPVLSREVLQAELERSRAHTNASLDALDPARMGTKVTVPNVPVDWTLRSWLWYVVEHEIHHKAQLALYLRQIGVVPPFFALAFPPGVRPDVRG